MATSTRRQVLKQAGMCAVAAVAGGAAMRAVSAPAAVAAPQGADLAPWAAERFLSHWNCSQALLEAFSPTYGLDMAAAQKVSTAFAGGMCTGGMCGCFTGALMVIGLAHGKSGAPDAHVAKHTTDFLAAMQQEFGALECSALLGTDMATPDGVKQAADKGLFTSLCPKLVEASVKKLQAIL